VSTTVPAVRIADGGNVGIGTGVPMAKLHVEGNIQASAIASTDSIRSHCLPSDAIILIDANGTFPANQNQGSYAMVETITGTIPAITGSVPVTTQSPFADIYKEGSAWFNGTAGNYITTSLTGYAPSGGLTFEAWVNYTSFTNADRTIGFHNPVGAGAAGNLSIGVNSSGVLILTYNASTVITPTANATLTLNTWNHIAFSYDGTTIRLFVNGVAATLTSTTLTTTIVGNLTVGQFNSLASSAYVANVRVVTGTALYTAAFTVPSAPLGLAATGTTRFLLRAGQNVPTVQSGALVFDRGLKQFLNFGPQTFNIVTKGFTAIWRGAFTGAVGSYERMFEFGPVNTNGGSCIAALRNVTNATVTFLLFPTNSGTPVGNVTATGSLTQGTSYVIIFRYNYITQIADIWINGVSNNSASVTTASLVGDRTVSFTYIGRPSDNAAYTSMTTSTFATYNRALTDTEIVNATTALLDTPVLPNNSTLEIGNLNSKPALSIAGDGRVNVQRLGQTSAVMEWPPSPMTGYVTVINGGTYVASASSESNSTVQVWKSLGAFVSTYWQALPLYTNNGYGGTAKTIVASGYNYSGEWIQIQLPYSVTLTSYTLKNANGNQFPTKGVLLGANDGLTWVEVHVYNNSSLLTNATFTILQSQSFVYYRFVTQYTNSANSNFLTLSLTLYGTADTQQPLEIAQPTTMKYPLIAPQITGPQNAGVYVPQDFSSSALNVPACFVASSTATITTPSTGPFANEGSIYFPGSAYMKLGNPAQLAYNWTNYDFTLETFVYLVNAGNIYDYHLLSRDGDILLYVQTTSNSLILYMAGVPNSFFVGGSVPFNQWAHISASWNSATQVMTIGVNGSVMSITRTGGTPRYTGTNSINISGWGDSFGYLNGYISNMRFIRGLALYQSAYTPPTAPLQPIQGITQAGAPYGTVLLLRNAPAPGRVRTQKLAGANSSSVLAFPPGPMTGYSTTINAGYGQGTYVASASTDSGGQYPAWQAFDRNNNLWVASYSYTINVPYAGTVTTIDANGTSYKGEWLQIQMPSAIVLANYSLRPQDGPVNTPSAWYVLGSRDGTNWNLIDTRAGQSWVSTIYNTYQIQSSQAFTHFRFVCYMISANALCSVSEWVLNGTIESVNITADGRVGLGVVAPVQALEVAGNVVVNGNISAGNMGMFRNRIINGDMGINQRGGASGNAGTVGTAPVSGVRTYNSVDRFITWCSITTGALQQLQVTLTTSDAPFQYGFRKSYRVTVTTACTNYAWIQPEQIIEANNVVDFNWGTGFGYPATTSFWFRSNATAGTPIYVCLRSPYNTGSGFWLYVTSFNITQASSWQYVSFVAPPPPPGYSSGSGTGSNAGIELMIAYQDLSTSNTSSLNTWRLENYTSGSRINDIYATVNTYVEFTGVQLEKGTIATPFEFRPYSMELTMCQRYYQEMPNTNGVHFTGAGRIIASINATNGVPVTGLNYTVHMRATPSPTYYGSTSTSGTYLIYTSSTGGQVQTSVSASSTGTGLIGGNMILINTPNVTSAGGSSLWIDMFWGNAGLGLTLSAEL
jgi:hypothetical protein